MRFSLENNMLSVSLVMESWFYLKARNCVISSIDITQNELNENSYFNVIFPLMHITWRTRFLIVSPSPRMRGGEEMSFNPRTPENCIVG